MDTLFFFFFLFFFLLSTFYFFLFNRNTQGAGAYTDPDQFSGNPNMENQRTQIGQVTWEQAKQECQSRSMGLCTGEQLTHQNDEQNKVPM